MKTQHLPTISDPNNSNAASSHAFYTTAASLTKTDFRLSLIGRCVDCFYEPMSFLGEEGYECGNCGRRYQFDQDRILITTPKRKPTQLSIYRSRLFHDWMQVWNREIKDWVIYRNSFFRFFSMSGHKRVKDLISMIPGKPVVVDFGCGAGKFFELYPEGLSIGIDSNPEFLRVMRKRHPDALAICGDISNSPFRTGALECPISLHTLEHIYTLGECVQEMSRVLSTSGKFIFCIPTEGGLGWSLGRRLVTGPRLKKKYGLDVQEIMKIEHINDAERVLRFLKWSFCIEQIRFSPFPFLPFVGCNSAITGVARRIDQTSSYYEAEFENRSHQ